MLWVLGGGRGEGSGFADNTHDLGILLETLVAAGAGVITEDFPLVEELDPVVVVRFGFSGSEVAYFADGYVAVGDGVGGEVEGISRAAVLEDEDIGDAGGIVSSNARGWETVAIAVVL